MGAVPGNIDDKTPATPARTRYEAVPGLVYLRRPCPVEGPAPGLAAASQAPSGTAGSGGPGTGPDSASGTTAGTETGNKTGNGDVPAPAAVRARIGMLVGVWLEVLDGRRPVSALRKGPFSPGVTEDLRGRIRDARPTPGAVSAPTVSRVLSVHLPPTRPDRLTFTASVTHGDRVRAVAGHLARYDGRWRVETMTLI
jgi:hypothetical protein